MTITHGACGAVWTGRAAAHCSRCCRTFGSTSAFDSHRRELGPVGRCLDPLAVGLVVGAGGVWRRPSMPADVVALRSAVAA